MATVPRSSSEAPAESAPRADGTSRSPDQADGAAPNGRAGVTSRGETSLPPGPRLPAIAQTLAWAVAPTWYMDHCARRVGDTFTLTFFPSGMKMVLVSDPEAVKTVFTAPPEVAPSGAGNSPVASVMGRHSVIVLTGPEHLRQRKLLLPPFHGERMREYEDVIVEATWRDMTSWPLGRPMQLQPHTRAITLEVILRAVFGVEAERMASIRTAISELIKPVSTPMMIRLALRVRPVVPITVRILQDELQVGDYRLPAGTRVTPAIYLTNRNPRVYEAPAEFRPERFLESGPETFSWIPFGGGIRRCIGAAFAQLEMKLILRTVLGELHPSLPRARRWRRGEWNRRRAITLVPAAGARVVWTKREQPTHGAREQDSAGAFAEPAASVSAG